MSEKYTVHDYTVEQILNFIKSDEIAIPEIQRPFVWEGGIISLGHLKKKYYHCVKI